MRFFQLFIIASIVFLVLDAIWIGLIVFPMYKKEMGHLLGDPVWWAALVFYVIYMIGLIVFVLQPNFNNSQLLEVAAMGFLFGLVCYATYDLTNLVTISGWSTKIALMDIVWGGTVTSLTSVLTLVMMRAFF